MRNKAEARNPQRMQLKVRVRFKLLVGLGFGCLTRSHNKPPSEDLLGEGAAALLKPALALARYRIWNLWLGKQQDSLPDSQRRSQVLKPDAQS